MNTIFQTLTQALRTPEVRKKIIFTAVIFLVYRIFAHIPVAGVNTDSLKQLFEQNQFLGLLNTFSGGTFGNFSILALGVSPYISASIIIQVLTMVFPKLEELQKEGDSGRKKINQYTRFLTVPLAVLQAISVYAILNSQGIITTLSPLGLITFLLTITAGSMFAVWLGELISERGVGNGISVLIFAGIIGGIPSLLGQTVATSGSENFIGLGIFLAVSLFVIVSVILVNEATRQITVHYAKRMRGNKMYGGQSTHLPLRLNQAGVIPIIFAVSLAVLPSFLANIFVTSKNGNLIEIGQFLTVWFNQDGWVYNAFYFFLVLGFTFFYTAVVFNPQKISDDMQKRGGFVPGVRPGAQTATYLNYILTRLTLVGAIFLGLIAVLPSIVKGVTGLSTLVLGGTSILIVVSVVLETYKAIEAQIVMRNYDGLLKK